jgi:glycosyltransferase involved in cell wall biosynthesis
MGRSESTSESPGLIDLTDPRRELKVAMIARFPPSVSGSACAASELASRLGTRFGIPVEVIRLMRSGEAAAAGHPVVMDVNPRWHMSGRLAARRANRCDISLVLLDRHVPLNLVEAFMRELETPIVLAVDEVPPAGTADALSLGALATRAATVVVPSESARRLLDSQSEGRIRMEVIPHGSPWRVFEPRRGERKHILTWGFIAPGMGAERVIRALALLGDLDPSPQYRVVGVTDPSWTRKEAARYRRSLKEEAERLGVADQVELVPLLHAGDDMAEEIEKSDLIAVVYDSRQAVASRILSEAVSTGRPVIATAFPGAIELLASGAGRTVAHDDDGELAATLRMYLTDEGEYLRSARIAAFLSPSLAWEEIARRYALLLTGEQGRVATEVKTTP